MYFIPAGCIAFILFFTVFGDKGLLRIRELRLDKEKIEARLKATRSENDKIKQELVALSTNNRYIESIARKELGLFRSNEVVYQFSQDKKPEKH